MALPGRRAASDDRQGQLYLYRQADRRRSGRQSGQDRPAGGCRCRPGEGASRGGYTGKKLSDFLLGDYFGARAIINGDKSRKEGSITIGEKIAGYARQFETALSAAGYGVKVEKPAPLPPEPVRNLSQFLRRHRRLSLQASL